MVAAQLQQWTTEETRMANLPLFLDGDAFLVWDELSDAKKKKRTGREDSFAGSVYVVTWTGIPSVCFAIVAPW